jgi:hypothetical protein
MEWQYTSATWLADTKRTRGSKPRGSEFVAWKSTLFPSFRRKPESRRFWDLRRKRTWVPAFAGMTNFHFALKARDFNIPERDIKLLPVILTMLNKR